MNRRIFVAISVLVLGLNAVPSVAADGVALPLPPKAKEVKHIKVDGGWLQTSYVVEEKYPDASVAQFYTSNIKTPWSRCFVGIPRWESFGDVSNGNNRFVHQRLMHWINRNEKKLLIVAMHYYSLGTETRSEPDTSSQYVTVAEYSEQDIEKAAELLKLKCRK
jgi:hypothetical protein